jgi:hypothetical protein
LSRGSQKKSTKVPEELTRELRQFTGLAASFFRAAAARLAARAHLRGWVSTFVFDDQTFSNMGNNVRLQSSGFEPTAPYYDIEVASSASMVTITSG